MRAGVKKYQQAFQAEQGDMDEKLRQEGAVMGDIIIDMAKYLTIIGYCGGVKPITKFE